jgi:hypothetical protein
MNCYCVTATINCNARWSPNVSVILVVATDEMLVCHCCSCFNPRWSILHLSLQQEWLWHVGTSSGVKAKSNSDTVLLHAASKPKQQWHTSTSSDVTTRVVVTHLDFIWITPDEVLVCHCWSCFNATWSTTVSLLPLVLTPNEVLLCHCYH